MNIQNQKKIADVIDSVIREENDAREKELQAAIKRQQDQASTIKDLNKKNSELERYKYLFHRLEEHTKTYMCPYCQGEGGFIYGEHGEGEECSPCNGKGLVSKEIQDKWNEENLPKAESNTIVANKQDEEELPF